MNRVLFLIIFIFCNCKVPNSNNKNSDLLLGELGIHISNASNNTCKALPSSDSYLKEWSSIQIDCPLGYKIPSLSVSDVITYTQLSSLDTATQSGFKIQYLAENQIRILSEEDLVAGVLKIKLNGIVDREGMIRDDLEFSFTIDTLSPNVTANFPSGIYDISVFLTNQFDLNFNESVTGIDQLTNYTISNSAGGSLTIRNIAKLSETSVRIFWQGTHPRQGGSLSLKISGIKDLAGNPLENTLSYRILGWTDGPSLSRGRRDFQIATLQNGDTLVIGGLGVISGSAAALLFVERWNHVTGSFQADNNLTIARRFANLSKTTDDRILLSGGFTTNLTGSITNSTNIYNPTTGTWGNGPTLSSARIGHGSCLIATNRILITGGRTTNTGSAVATSEIVTLNGSGGGTIQSITSMSTSRMNHQCLALPDGRFWIVGGSGLTTEIFDPSNDSFSAGPDLIVAQDMMVALKDSSGNHYLIGGRSGSLSTDIIQKLDVVTNKVSLHNYMAKGRIDHAGAVLPDGNFLIQGGNVSSSSSVLSDVEKNWTKQEIDGFVLNATKQGREGHKLLVLPDGKIMVLGGLSGVGVPDYITNTEIFGF
ncbi:MAG: kelch repeat-containing protein [Leptospira sp.]|nr:kelch repeat-containing protein [Leptospira sp.]